MRGERVFFGFITILLVSLLFLYWFFPGQEIQFDLDPNYNFSVDNSNASMQFYENMRFPDSEISYKIQDDCTLQKKGEMLRAFQIIEEETDLIFIEDKSNSQINIACNEKNKVDEGLFIAGEGGPVDIIPGDNFNVILSGKILLIRDSDCERPNVAIHELLHVLGFNHSQNQNNIMYPISKCKQIIGEEIPNTINELYSTESLPDLRFEEVSAAINGRTLDINLSVKNDGLVSSKKAKIIIVGDEKIIKEMDLEELKIGYEVKITLGNVWLNKAKIDELDVLVEYDYPELSKDNNKVSLKKQE